MERKLWEPIINSNMRTQRLRWLVHILRTEDNRTVKLLMAFQVEANYNVSQATEEKRYLCSDRNKFMAVVEQVKVRVFRKWVGEETKRRKMEKIQMTKAVVTHVCANWMFLYKTFPATWSFVDKKSVQKMRYSNKCCTA